MLRHMNRLTTHIPRATCILRFAAYLGASLTISIGIVKPELHNSPVDRMDASVWVPAKMTLAPISR